MIVVIVFGYCFDGVFLDGVEMVNFVFDVG